MTITLIFVTVIYCIIIAIFIVGWYAIPIYKRPLKSNQLPALSVIICCRNEAENLPALIASLKAQSFQNFEMIFANDHSTDNSMEILENFRQIQPNVHIVNCVGTGKKNAQREAIAVATNSIVFCCDADCILPKQLLETVAAYHNEHRPDLLIGGVKYEQKNSFHAIQACEFGSLVASAAGSCGTKMPILCNGANLSFPVEIWRKYAQNLHLEATSGDDMFLLQNIKRNNGKIAFLKTEDTFVTTQPTKNLSDFFNQRKRWSAKTTLYDDWQSIFVAITVFGWCLVWLCAVIMAIFSDKFGLLVAICWGIKLLFDLALLVPFFLFSGQKQILPYIIPTALIYPPYIVYTALSSLFSSFVWKGKITKR